MGMLGYSLSLCIRSCSTLDCDGESRNFSTLAGDGESRSAGKFSRHIPFEGMSGKCCTSIASQSSQCCSPISQLSVVPSMHMIQ